MTSWAVACLFEIRVGRQARVGVGSVSLFALDVCICAPGNSPKGHVTQSLVLKDLAVLARLLES